MRSLLGIALLVCAVSCSSRHADARGAAPVFQPDENELRKGHIVHAPDETAFMLVRAPIADTWKLLADVEHWPQLFGDLRSVRTLGKAGKFTVYGFVAKAPKPFGDKKYALVFPQPQGTRLEFWLDKTQPGDVKDCTGYWEVRPAEGGAGTLVVYHANFEIGLPVPGFLRKKMVESLMNDFRDFMSRQQQKQAQAAGPAAQ